jgi:hypothetical protein
MEVVVEGVGGRVVLVKVGPGGGLRVGEGIVGWIGAGIGIGMVAGVDRI